MGAAAAAGCDADVDKHRHAGRLQQFSHALGASCSVPERDQRHPAPGAIVVVVATTTIYGAGVVGSGQRCTGYNHDKRKPWRLGWEWQAGRLTFGVPG